jgi:hypothetical protein
MAEIRKLIWSLPAPRLSGEPLPDQVDCCQTLPLPGQAVLAAHQSGEQPLAHA